MQMRKDEYKGAGQCNPCWRGGGGGFYIKILHSSMRLSSPGMGGRGQHREGRQMRGSVRESVSPHSASAVLLFILQICPLIPGGKVCFWEDVSTGNELLGTFPPPKYRLEVQADQRLLLTLAYTRK